MRVSYLSRQSRPRGGIKIVVVVVVGREMGEEKKTTTTTSIDGKTMPDDDDGGGQGAVAIATTAATTTATAAAESALTSLHNTLRLPGARRCVQVWVADKPDGSGGSRNIGGDNGINNGGGR